MACDHSSEGNVDFAIIAESTTNGKLVVSVAKPNAHTYMLRTAD
jgi:hypothetical protein